MSNKNRISLPSNYKRSLTVTSRHVERAIKEIEQLLVNQHERSSLINIIKNINEENSAKILSHLSELKHKNEQMVKEFELITENLFEDRIIRSKLTHLWVILSDSTSEALKGYGDLEPEQAKVLDNEINSLLEIIEKILNSF